MLINLFDFLNKLNHCQLWSKLDVGAQ